MLIQGLAAILHMPYYGKTLDIYFRFDICTNCNGAETTFKAVTEKIKLGQRITAKDFGFKEYNVLSHGDTITFYTFQKNNSNPLSIYISLPGTNAENIYSYHKDTNGLYWYNSLTNFDFSYLPENYLFVIVAKPGFGFCGNGDSDIIPQKYWNKTFL